MSKKMLGIINSEAKKRGMKLEDLKEACESILSILDESEKNELSYDEYIKRDYKIIEKETNLASQRVYKTFKEHIYEDNGPDSKYPSKAYIDDVDQFYKDTKSAPKVKKISKDDSNSYIIDLNYTSKTSNDMLLFYDDEVCKELKKSEKLKSLGYHISNEDYLGIYIER